MLVALVALAGSAAPAGAVGADPSPPSLAGPAAPQGAATDLVVDRVLRDRLISESSGLALSPTHAGLIWTVNDSGNPPIVFGVDADGRTRVRLRVATVPNVDWEALVAWRDPSGRAFLAVADIGDNGAVRDRIEVDILAEPARLQAVPTTDADQDDAPGVEVRPLRRVRLRYPDGAKDAESLVVDPRTQRMYVISKGLLRARVYAVPRAAWPGGSSDVATLEPVGDLGLSLATDAAALPTGHLLVRSYGAAMLIAPLPSAQQPERQLVPLATIGLPAQGQGEGLAATADEIYLSTEGRATPVLRLAMPLPFLSAIGPAAGTSPSVPGAGSPSGAVASPETATAGTLSPGTGSGSRDDRDAGGSDRGLLAVALGLFALAALVVAAVRVRRRVHR